MNGCAPGLALIERPRATQQWDILWHKSSSGRSSCYEINFLKRLWHFTFPFLRKGIILKTKRENPHMKSGLHTQYLTPCVYYRTICFCCYLSEKPIKTASFLSLCNKTFSWNEYIYIYFAKIVARYMQRKCAVNIWRIPPRNSSCSLFFFWRTQETQLYFNDCMYDWTAIIFHSYFLGQGYVQ